MTWESEFAYVVRTDLTQNERVTISAVLDDAAAHIERYGWKNGPTPYWEQNDSVPLCVWQAALRSLERNYQIKKLPSATQAINYALVNVTQADDLNDLFDLNDAQPLEEGQRWAAETLRLAAQFLRTVFADLPGEAADTDSTQSQDSGFIRNVVDRVKRLLKK
jgi:hypothetical protein